MIRTILQFYDLALPQIENIDLEELRKSEVLETVGRLKYEDNAKFTDEKSRKKIESAILKLAQKACGKYYYLPNGTDREIAAATAQAMSDAGKD